MNCVTLSCFLLTTISLSFTNNTQVRYGISDIFRYVQQLEEQNLSGTTDILDIFLKGEKTLSVFTEEHNPTLDNSGVFHLVFKQPVLLYNNKVSPRTESHSLTTIFLFIVESLRAITVALEKSQIVTNWKPESKFFVFVSDLRPNFQDIEEMFDIFFKKHLINVILISQDNDINTVNTLKKPSNKIPTLYLHFPFSGQTSVVRAEAYLLNDENNLGRDCHIKNTSYFPDRTIDLKGYNIRASTFMLPPHIILSPPDGGVGSTLSGVEGNIINTISTVMNFSLIAKPPKDHQKWGQRLSNGTYTGQLGDLVYGRADIAFGNVIAFQEYLEHLGMSTSISVQHLILAVPKALQLPYYMSLILSFEYPVWICICVVMIISPTILNIMGRVYCYMFESRDNVSGGLNWLSLWSALLGISPSVRPMNWVYKTFYIFFLYYSFIISTAYLSLMVGFLTAPLCYPEINTMKDLISSDLLFGGPHAIREFFEDFTDDTNKIMYEKWHNTLAFKESVERVAIDRDFAFSLNKVSMEFLMHVMFPECDSGMRIMQEPILTFHPVFFLKKGTYLEPRLSTFVSRLKEGGIIQQWGKEETSRIRPKQMNSSLLRLPLSNLSAVFIVYFFGIGLSALTLLGEIMQHKFCRR